MMQTKPGTMFPSTHHNLDYITNRMFNVYLEKQYSVAVRGACYLYILTSICYSNQATIAWRAYWSISLLALDFDNVNSVLDPTALWLHQRMCQWSDNNLIFVKKSLDHIQNFENGDKFKNAQSIFHEYKQSHWQDVYLSYVLLTCNISAVVSCLLGTHLNSMV